MKYICTESDEGLPEVFIFPKTVEHTAMAEGLRRLRKPKWAGDGRTTRTAVSAGFVDAEGRCHGHSESLNLDSRPEDTEILARQR